MNEDDGPQEDESDEADTGRLIKRLGERRSKAYARLGVISFGLATGTTFALFVFFLGIMASFFEWGLDLAAILSSYLIGYGPSFVGAIAGAVWAFVTGFLLGLLNAWLYNRFLAGRRHGGP